MKRIFLCLAAAFLLGSCSDTKSNDKPDKPDPEKSDTTSRKKPKPEKKPEEQKEDIKNIFEKAKDDVTKEDRGGWSDDREEELKTICMNDAGAESGDKVAMAYCNCLVDNLKKIFDSYADAMKLFNKTEDDLSEADMKKLEMIVGADESCWQQNMGDEYNEEEDDMTEEERYGTKGKGKKNQ